MAKKVLIVEDEASASRLVASLCSEVGLAAVETRTGNEAKTLLERAGAAGEPFTAVVLDLVLGEVDGFRVGQFLRSQPWGASTPLVVMSGVYKQANPELMRELRPAAYFAKPFEPAQMRDALVKACDVQGVATAIEGDLSQKPAPAVFIDLLRQKASGVLTVTLDSTVRRLHFQQGQVRFAQSTVLAESAGSAQVASGIVKQASFDRAVAMSRQNKVPLHEALAHSRVMSPEQLKLAVRQQTVEASLGALAMDSGHYRFDPQPQAIADSVPDARVSPVALVVDAAKRFAAPAQSKKWLEARRDSTFQRTPELDRELFTVRQSWPGEGVTAFATAGRGAHEALSRVKEAELPLLHWLCVSGLVQLASAQAEKPVAPKKNLADLDRGKNFDPREQAARKMLVETRDRWRDANHYQVLGVQHGADAEAIKAAYFEAAKKLHSDSFSGMELGSARSLVEQLFTRVGEAYGVLTDPEKRAEYDVYLDRKAKGLPTDVGAILRAEEVFRRGEKLFKSGRWEEAEAAFREAASLNGAEAEFHAYLGMTIFRKRGDAREATSFIERALQMDPRLKSGTLFHAQICESQGDLENAKSILRKAVEQDPGFDEAQKELARLRRGPPEPEKKGLLTRLLKK